jgi:hypothetical protein
VLELRARREILSVPSGAPEAPNSLTFCDVFRRGFETDLLIRGDLTQKTGRRRGDFFLYLISPQSRPKRSFVVWPGIIMRLSMRLRAD